MAQDIVKDLYDKSKRQDKVVFQQKKPLLNYELNLAQDILKNREIDLTLLSIFNNYNGDAFKVYASSLNNEIKIRQGTFYHLGRPIQLTQDITLDTVDGGSTSLTTPTSDRTDTVFVEWFLEEIDASDDPTIKDSVLGFETAQQERLNVTIKITENSLVPSPSTTGPNGEEIFYFIISRLNRLSGNAAITEAMIEDQRDRSVYNYVTEGCLIEEVSGLNVSVSEGNVFVGDIEYYIEDTTPNLTMTANTTNYVYVDVSGVVTSNTSEPYDFHVMLAEVTTDSTSITDIEDKRDFIPIAWNNKYSGEGSGETGYPAVTQKYKAGENISAYDAVYISGSNIVSKATASDGTKLPVIGISPQSFSTGQIDNIVVFGEIQNTAWSWTPNANIFLDTSTGLLTETAPTTSGTYVQRVGIAVTSNILLVKPDLLYIKNSGLATPILIKKANGDIEVASTSDKIDPDSLSFLAAIENDPNNRTFTIKSGRYYVNDTEDGYFTESVINLGPGQAYETTALTPNYYNKAFFTLDSTGTIQMYESIENSASAFVDDPEIPDNELPIVMAVIKDDGTGTAGTIDPIAQDDLIDKRGWLNLGNLDGVSFKPLFRNSTDFIVQSGEGWFNNLYITSTSNILKTGTVASDTTYYIYMDLTDASGGVTTSSFVTLTDSISQVDRRKYIPLGEYTVSSGNIQRNTFKGYSSRFWQYRDAPYEDQQIFDTDSGPQASFTVTSFTFTATDDLQILINGHEVFEGASDDYTKTPPNTVTFNYSIKTGAEIRIRKV